MSHSVDRELGMQRPILRRDFLSGTALTIGAALLPAQESPVYYPPALTGLRGSHPGSFEVAHKLRDDHGWDLAAAANTNETYDLVIVGGGISGLSAAYFFLKDAGRSARVLILDNHDDFGGHAKRNEFRYGGRLLALNGGTLNIESPVRYNAPAKEVLHEIGIDLDRYLTANSKNHQLYQALGLAPAYFFDKETWGADRLAVGWGGRGNATAEHLANTPVSDRGRQDLLRLYDPHQPDYMPGLSSAEKKDRLARMSYNDFLLNLVKVDKQLLWFFQTRPQGLFCVGTDATPALFCWEMGYPGFAGMSLEPTPEGRLADLPGGHHGRQKAGNWGGEIHLPDGNATVARLLVRWLIPDAVPGKTMEEMGTTRVNYSLLDRTGQAARLRLNSTVVNVRHDGDAAGAKEVVVSYVTAGKSHQVRGRACVMACWNAIIPYLAPELPAQQKEALAFAIKSPIVYSNVAIRNWTSFQKLGISAVSAPGMYHPVEALTEAASLGDLKHPQTPEEPIVIRMVRTPCAPGKTRKEQHRLGRIELMGTSFENFERTIRDQLARTLSGGGFDPARDIVAITVNRWPHGYTYTYNSLYDPMDWVFTSTDARPCVTARKPFGRIAIANSDAAASPHTDAAILEAHRAIGELKSKLG